MLPFKSVTEKYKVGKAHFVAMLHESINPTIQKTIPALRTWTKWKSTCAFNPAQNTLILKEVTEYTNTNKQSFDKDEVRWWPKMPASERRELVAHEFRETKD